MSSTAAPPFVDTNILLRFVLGDVPDQFTQTHAFFSAIAAGSVTAQLSGTIIFECVFVLQSRYAVTRASIQSALLPILALEHLIVPHREIYPDVFDLYLARRSLSFADCYHAVLAQHLGCTEIISFDRGFDRIPGLTRIEPRAMSR